MKITKEYILEALLIKTKNGFRTRKNIPENISKEKIYNVLYDIQDEDRKCPYCSKNKKFKSINKGYFSTCSSPKCTYKARNIDASNTIVNFILTKENVNDFFSNGRINSRKTNKYSVTPKDIYDIKYPNIEKKCIMCNEEYKFRNFQRGYIKKCKCSLSCPIKIKKKVDIKEKIRKCKETKFKRYNDENYCNKDKIKETKLKRYNDENYNNPEKNKITNKKKYKHEYFFSTDEFKVKSKNTNILRYRVENISQINIKNSENITKEYIEEHFILEEKIKMQEMSAYFNIGYSTGYKILKKLNVKYSKKSVSFSEIEINSLFNGIFEQNNRSIISPLEIDLFSYEYKFGIEYNGLIWHSIGDSKYNLFNNLKDLDILKYRHLNKTNLCEEKGYSLFHIFENEWLDKNKKDIWISIIKEKMNKNKIINTKNAIIKEVNKEITKEFLKDNHLDGYIDSCINLGLYKDNILYSIMCFNNKDGNSMLTRMCNKIGYSLDNSKILDYFEKEYKPETITIEVNRRFDNGDNLIKLGFIHKEDTEPNGKKCLENRVIFDVGNRILIKSY